MEMIVDAKQFRTYRQRAKVVPGGCALARDHPDHAVEDLINEVWNVMVAQTTGTHRIKYATNAFHLTREQCREVERIFRDGGYFTTVTPGWQNDGTVCAISWHTEPDHGAMNVVSTPMEAAIDKNLKDRTAHWRHDSSKAQQYRANEDAYDLDMSDHVETVISRVDVLLNGLSDDQKRYAIKSLILKHL